MREDRLVLTWFILALAIVIGVSSAAINHAEPVESVPLSELPLAVPVNAFDPSTESCQAAGGTIAYERTSECVSVPSVMDACGWGFPCFFAGNESTCREVRRAYCACATSADCPTNYTCNTYGRESLARRHPEATAEGRCQAISYVPKPY